MTVSALGASVYLCPVSDIRLNMHDDMMQRTSVADWQEMFVATDFQFLWLSVPRAMLEDLY